MRQLKAWGRLARALVHILRGLMTIVLGFPRFSQAQKQARVQAWSRQLLFCIGIKLVVRGDCALDGPLLLVANHISWLDITSLHAVRFCRFVSKADIKQWPVIGRLASGAGTLFIERESRRDAMRVVHTMAASLQSGDVIAIFPEGTTSDGRTMLPFHANLVQAAISANAPVQPVSLQFVDAASGQPSYAPAYAGTDSLAKSVWRTLCAPDIAVIITFGDAQHAHGRDRREWALALRACVDALRRKD